MTVETGRGTRDIVNTTRGVPGLAAVASIRLLSVLGDAAGYGGAGILISWEDAGDTNDVRTIVVGSNPTATGPSLTVTVDTDIPSGPLNQTQILDLIVAGVNQAANFGFTARRIGRNIAEFTQDTAGDVSILSVSNNTGNVIRLNNFEDGHAGSLIDIEEPEYAFDGPFDNTIPVGDPLQGMVRYAERLVTFFDAVADAANVQAIDAAAGALRTGLIGDFPIDILPKGDHPEGLIPIKGTFRGPSRTDIFPLAPVHDRLVGRGKARARYTNSVANYGVVQLILRRLDSFFDLMNEIRRPASDLASIKLYASEIDETFNLEADGSLPRARGFEPIAYDNTIVDRTAEQGLLVYCDRIYEIAGLIQAGTSTTPAALRATIANADINKLDLRN